MHYNIRIAQIFLLISFLTSFSRINSQENLSHSEQKIQYLDSSFNVCSLDSAMYERYATFCSNGRALYITHTEPTLIRNACSMVEFEEGIKLIVEGEITFYYKNKNLYGVDTYKGGFLQSTKFFKRQRLSQEVIYDYRNVVNDCSCSIYLYDKKGIKIIGYYDYTLDD